MSTLTRVRPRAVALAGWLLWAVAVIGGGWLDSTGHHRAGRLLAGTIVAVVGAGILLDYRGAVSDTARAAARWHSRAPGWLTHRRAADERLQLIGMRVFGGFAVVLGAVLLSSGVADVR